MSAVPPSPSKAERRDPGPISRLSGAVLLQRQSNNLELTRHLLEIGPGTLNSLAVGVPDVGIGQDNAGRKCGLGRSRGLLNACLGVPATSGAPNLRRRDESLGLRHVPDGGGRDWDGRAYAGEPKTKTKKRVLRLSSE
jgi:hypothetical protein